MAKTIGSLVLILALAACAQVTATPEPLEQYSVVTSPELEPLVVEWLKAYQDLGTNTILELETKAPAQMADPTTMESVDLLISAGPPPSTWFATPLLREPLAIIVNPENDISSLSVEDLGEIFSGRVSTWSAFGGPEELIQPVISVDGEASRAVFQVLVLSDSGFTPNALLAPNPSFMRSMVAERPGGIGFVGADLLTSDVRRIEITTLDSGAGASADFADSLSLDILAMAKEEPTGGLRQFLVWLQGSLEP